MFSEIWRTSDITELWLNGKEGPLRLQVGDQVLNDLRRIAFTIPTKKHLLAWARWVAGQEWHRCGSLAHAPLPLQDREKITFEKVAVRRIRLDFQAAIGLHSAQDVGLLLVDSKGTELKVGNHDR